MNHRKFALAGLLVVAAAATASADVVHDEGLHGDLSNDRFAPSAFVLGMGSNSISATSQAGDREFVALTIPAGLQLAAILQMSFVGEEDGVAFAAVDDAPQFLVDPDSFSTEGMLGWTHFGSLIFMPGDDLMPAMGMGGGADGFIPPLPAGTYTFWFNQTGAPTTYELDFVVTPAPGASILIGLGGLLAARRRR